MKRFMQALIAIIFAGVFLFAVMLSCGLPLVFAAVFTAAFVALCLAHSTRAARASPQRSIYSVHNGNTASGKPADRSNHSVQSYTMAHLTTGRSRQYSALHSNIAPTAADPTFRLSHLYRDIVTFISGIFFYARDRNTANILPIIDQPEFKMATGHDAVTSSIAAINGTPTNSALKVRETSAELTRPASHLLTGLHIGAHRPLMMTDKSEFYPVLTAA